MMVAGVIEAMASHLSYRPGLSIDKALAEIRHGATYDPQIADTCLRIFHEKGYQLPVRAFAILG